CVPTCRSHRSFRWLDTCPAICCSARASFVTAGMRSGRSPSSSPDFPRCWWACPSRELMHAGAEMIVNLSASPFSVGKYRLREDMLGSLARRHGVPVVYVNQFGGNDDLVFDGRSCAFTADGAPIARGRSFDADIVVCDVDHGQAIAPLVEERAESEIWRALVLGTRDYARKCGFQSVVLGLSGGIDSALTP